jgi:lipoate synthase
VFGEYKSIGLDMGFEAVASSPLTRSSMDADRMFER